MNRNSQEAGIRQVYVSNLSKNDFASFSHTLHYFLELTINSYRLISVSVKPGLAQGVFFLVFSLIYLAEIGRIAHSKPSAKIISSNPATLAPPGGTTTKKGDSLSRRADSLAPVSKPRKCSPNRGAASAMPAQRRLCSW